MTTSAIFFSPCKFRCVISWLTLTPKVASMATLSRFPGTVLLASLRVGDENVNIIPNINNLIIGEARDSAPVNLRLRAVSPFADVQGRSLPRCRVT